MNGAPRVVAIAIWVLAPCLLALSLWRPVFETSSRAPSIPDTIGGFHKTVEQRITKNFVRLLGTRDVAWRTYADEQGKEVYLVAVFHDQNWKSLHPPHICIRGTNFDISADRNSVVEIGGRKVTLGRLDASRKIRNRTEQDPSFYAFVGQDFVTPSYVGFFLKHAPRALLRSATTGFLIRVETFVGPEGVEAAEQRCFAFLRVAMPICEGLIR